MHTLRKRMLTAIIALCLSIILLPFTAAGEKAEASKETGTVYYATRDMNVREGPNSKRYAVVGRLSAGEKITVTNYSNKWSEIDYNGNAAYVFTEYITQDIAKAYRNHAFVKLIGKSKIKSVTLAEDKQANLTYRGNELFDAETLLKVTLKKPYAPLRMTLAIYADAEAAKAKFIAITDPENAFLPDVYVKYYAKDNVIACWVTSTTLDEYTRTADKFDDIAQARFYEFADAGEK